MIPIIKEDSPCGNKVNSNQDEEQKDESDSQIDGPSHVTSLHASVSESDEEGFPFKQNPDSLALQSVYRYAKQIKYFLGWDEIKEDSEPEEDREYSDVEENSGEHFSQEESCILNNDNQVESIPFNSNEENTRETSVENNRDTENNEADNYKKECFSENEEIGLIHKNIEGGDLIINNEIENKIQPQVFRSEVCLDIEDCRLSKPVLLPNKSNFPEPDNFVSNLTTNEIMDENLVQDNDTESTGLSLSVKKDILNDEQSGISSLESKEKCYNDVGINENILENSENNNYLNEKSSNENNESNENNVENKSSGETSNELPDDEREAINDINGRFFENNIVQNKNDTFEKQSEIKEDAALNVFQVSKPVKTSDCLTKCSTEDKQYFTIKTKTDNSFKAHIQYENETKKQLLSKEIKCNEKRVLERQSSLIFEEDTVCGLGCFKPWWLQPCATVKVYVVLYSIIGILHGSYYSYLIGTLSTLEKRFAFKSKISGAVMVADEVTPLLLGMIIGYYAGKAHRPRMVAFGMLLSAGSCFSSSLPYFIFGPVQHLNLQNLQNDVGPEYCDPDIGIESCDSADRPPTLAAVLLLVFGSFLKGFGNLAYYAIGLAYLDDNSDKKNTPIYLATALALRLLGPLVGFLMSSGFLKLYENPFDDPGYGPDDPRWIGAWWIGFFLQGVLLIIFTLPIALFPRRLPGQKMMDNASSPATNDSLKDIFLGLLSALKRLGKNPVFIILIINTTMKIFGHFGHAIMLPKYMENQFRLSASEASLFSGATTIFCIMVSTVLGGFLIWKFRPRIKVLLVGMITSEVVLCAGFLILMIPRCQYADMSHFGMNDEGLVLNSFCNQNCDCSTTSFTPFCGPDGKTTYFSPCYAGCTQDFTTTMSSKKNKEFGNCSCVLDPVQNQAGATISEGFCPDENCWNQALVYLIILFCVVVISNMFTVAHTMILLRSVHPNDKSVALGTFETFICLFGFIPFPVTFGALVDSACLVWEKSCGEAGNCWFYDMGKFGYLLHGAAALFCFMSVVCLTILYFLSSRVRNLYDEEEEEEKGHIDIKLDTVSGSTTKL